MTEETIPLTRSHHHSSPPNPLPFMQLGSTPPPLLRFGTQASGKRMEHAPRIEHTQDVQFKFEASVPSTQDQPQGGLELSRVAPINVDRVLTVKRYATDTMSSPVVVKSVVCSASPFKHHSLNI